MYLALVHSASSHYLMTCFFYRMYTVSSISTDHGSAEWLCVSGSAAGHGHARVIGWTARSGSSDEAATCVGGVYPTSAGDENCSKLYK